MNLGVKRFCVTGVFVIIQLTTFAAAQPIKLAWDSNSATGQVGYNLYRSNRAGVYTEPPLNGSTLLRKPSFSDSSAQTGETYYYAVTTVGPDGLESEFSNEVKVVVNPTPFINRPAGGLMSVSGHIGSAIRKLPHHSSGMALIRYEQNQFLVSEAAIRAAPLVRSGRTYVEFRHLVNTGVALVNSSPHPVVIDFYFTDEAGNKLHAGSFAVRANTNTIGLLNEAPFVPRSKFDLRRARTFTFSASAPIAFTAIRGFTSERSEFIMTPLPVSAGEPVATASTIIPYYAEGGPWKTRIVLTNPANIPSSGVLDVFGSASGDPLQRLNYVIPSASAIELSLAAESDIRAGWIRITPSEGNVHPSALALISFGSTTGIEYEFGVTAMPVESAFLIYVESSGIKSEPGSVESSVVLTNSASRPALIHLDVLQMDGTYTGLQQDLHLPPNGQTTISDEITELLTAASPFKGFLRFSGTSTTAVGLKSSYNERGQLLVTPMPAIPESAEVSSAEELFLFANVPGYVTSLFVFDPR